MSFKDSLRRLMDEKKIKAVTLSKETGLSEGVISEYLSGKKEPKGRGSILIARALGVSLDELWDTEFKSFPAIPHLIFRERLVELLEQNNMTMDYLSKITGIPYMYMSVYCSGARGPTISDAISIADVFKISLDELVGRESVSVAYEDETYKYVGYKQMTENEQTLIKKYRAIDLQGKKAVDAVLTIAFEKVRPNETGTESLSLEEQADEFAVVAREQFLNEKKLESQASYVSESAAG